MEMGIILLKQTITMFLLMAVGFALFKKKLITEQGTKEMSRMLITIIIPCVIIKSYLTEINMEKLINLGIAFIMSVISLVVSIMVSKIIYGKNKKVQHFGVAFSNAGFVGIPLVNAILKEEAVFYVAIFVALLNILQWTYGVMVMTDSKQSISAKKIVTNPVLIGLAIGLLIFITKIQIPDLLSNCIAYIGSLNTPIAMIILGSYLAQTNVLQMFKEKRIYMDSAVRLVIISALTLVILSVFPQRYYMLKIVTLIAACTPIGSNVAIFAQLNNLDYTYAVKMVCLSTILSIVTMPLIIIASEYVL